MKNLFLRRRFIPALLLSFTLTLSAAPLLYDGFGSYTVGGALIGSAHPGTGNTWTGIGSGTDQAMTDGVTLSYLTAPRTSGRVVLPPNFISPGASAPQAAALGFTGAGGDVYYSFLIRLQDVSGLAPAFQLLTRLTFNTNTFGPAVFVRPTPGTNTFDLGIHKRANGGEVVTDAGLSGLVTGTRHLVVVKYEAQPGNSNDAVKIWLNPTALGYVEPVATFSATNGNDIAVAWNGFELHPPAGLAGADQNYFDELRVGRTWAEVAGPLAVSEPFNYTPGENLIGQTNAETFSVWKEIGTSTTHSTIASNSLSYAPLRSSGNRVQLASFSGSTRDASLAFAGVGSEVYASFLLRLDSLGASMSTSFQNLARLVSGATAGPVVVVRKNAGDGTKFDLGIHKRGNTGSAVTTAALQTLATNTPHLIVIKYVVDTNDNDAMQIWVNPPPASLGGVEPAATFISTNGTDTTAGWNAFELYPPNQVSGFFDEIRVGLTWASVTTVSTTTAVASSANPATEGGPVTFTATVASGGSNAPSGAVLFKANGYALAGPVGLDTNGVAQLTVSTLPPGTNVIRAEFLGADGLHPSAAILAGGQVVNAAPTTSEITGITRSGGSVILNCQGAAGVSYDVQRATEVTFTTGLTTLLTTNAPGGGAFTVTDPGPPSARAFYRLKQNP